MSTHNIPSSFHFQDCGGCAHDWSRHSIPHDSSMVAACACHHSYTTSAHSTPATRNLQVPRDNAGAAAELLFDSVARPSLLPHILEEQAARISAANNDLVRDPAFLASEGVVSVAYSGSLARPSFWSGAPMSADVLADFHADVRSQPSGADPSRTAHAFHLLIPCNQTPCKFETDEPGSNIGTPLFDPEVRGWVMLHTRGRVMS